MTETKITDEMVVANALAFRPCNGNFNCAKCDPICAPCLKHSRAGLEAALNPPPEPEIEVTEGMKIAGANEYLRWWNADDEESMDEGMAGVYSAMEATRMKEQAAPYGAKVCKGHLHRRESDAPHYIYGETYTPHRRKGDQT